MRQQCCLYLYSCGEAEISPHLARVWCGECLNFKLNNMYNLCCFVVKSEKNCVFTWGYNYKCKVKMCSLKSAKNLGFWEIFDQKRFYSSSAIWQACIFDVNGADGVFGWALLYPGHQPEPHYVHGRAHIFPIHGQKLGLDNEMKWLTGLLFGIFNRCLLT